MASEIQLISDGDGLVVLGDPTDVERFVASEGLPSKELGSSRIRKALTTGAIVAQFGAEIAANSGRWVKLTSESAQTVKKFGFMATKTPGISHAMVGQPGNIKNWIQIVTGPGSLATNPALLTGVAGLMAQLAMQQAIDEILDYLKTIDKKLDDVLRSQTNQVLARMDGVDLAIQEAMSVREAVGRVSEITWSKVQNTSETILETQGYALRQLGDLADKIERETNVDDLAKTVKNAETQVQKWIAVLAHCFRLQDAIAVIELDRVLDGSPDELDRHRLGLKAARHDRLGLIGQSAGHLLERMIAAAGTANSKVLLNPISSPAVVKSSNLVAVEIHEFQGLLGIESGTQSSESRPWADAASESWDKVSETGADGWKKASATGAEGFEIAKHFGKKTSGQAKSARDKLFGKIAERALRKHEADEKPGEQG